MFPVFLGCLYLLKTQTSQKERQVFLFFKADPTCNVVVCIPVGLKGEAFSCFFFFLQDKNAGKKYYWEGALTQVKY